jgi:DNA-binding GntR family transcriptional regulator
MSQIEAPTMADIAAGARNRYRTAEEMVVAAIRQAIVIGVFAPGERLPQEALAQQLGVSRIPVRAAFRTLEAEGLVVVAPHRGATVKPLQPEELEEIYALRALLEGFAVRAAISRITEAEVAELEGLAARLDAPEAASDWLDTRDRFSERLCEIAGLSRTAEMIVRLKADVGRYWRGIRVVVGEDSGHTAIMEAIRAGDADGAEAWLRRHLSAVGEELRDRMPATTPTGAVHRW